MVMTIFNGSTSNITSSFQALPSYYRCCPPPRSALSGATLLARRIKHNQKTDQTQLHDRTTAHEALLSILEIVSSRTIKQHYQLPHPHSFSEKMNRFLVGTNATSIASTLSYASPSTSPANC